jgi:hypothetical protein
LISDTHVCDHCANPLPPNYLISSGEDLPGKWCNEACKQGCVRRQFQHISNEVRRDLDKQQEAEFRAECIRRATERNINLVRLIRLLHAHAARLSAS